MSTNDTLPKSNIPKPLDKEKADAWSRKSHKILKQLHFCGTLTVQTIASALLITVFLWLFARPPDPQVHVTSFKIEALNTTITPLPTIMNYEFTIHNSDLYKSLNYIVLALRISYSQYPTWWGATIDFDVGENGLTQRPGKTDILPNHTLNYNYTNLGRVSDDFKELKNTTTSMYLRFVMEARVMVFGKVVASRQMMKSADLYFDQNGHAIITPPGGLAFK